MRVLLSGTSNSILARGIKYPLARDPRVTSFTNRSYGASGTVALANHLQYIDFTKYDFCILDYCVNEEVFISINESTTDSAMNNLMAAVDAASRAGCQPLILILPTSTRANYPRPFETAIIDKLGEHAVPIFNFYTFSKAFCGRTGLDFKDLFLDPMHIHREIGEAIGAALVDYMATHIKVTPTTATPSYEYDPLGFIPYKQFNVTGKSIQMQRESSLLQRSLLQITPEATITATAAASGHVTGVCFDASRSVGTLTASAFQQICLSLKPNVPFFRQTRGLTLVMQPIPTPVVLDDNHKITLTYNFNGTLDDHIHPHAALTISGLSVRYTNQKRPLHVLTRNDGPCALSDWLFQEHWGSLNDQIKTLIS